MIYRLERNLGGRRHIHIHFALGAGFWGFWLVWSGIPFVGLEKAAGYEKCLFGESGERKV